MSEKTKSNVENSETHLFNDEDRKILDQVQEGTLPAKYAASVISASLRRRASVNAAQTGGDIEEINNILNPPKKSTT
jgi:hypothetical protein